jgi:hypothetical protein
VPGRNGQITEGSGSGLTFPAKESTDTLIAGAPVNTKYGMVNTDHILFIGAAFTGPVQ